MQQQMMMSPGGYGMYPQGGQFMQGMPGGMPGGMAGYMAAANGGGGAGCYGGCSKGSFGGYKGDDGKGKGSGFGKGKKGFGKGGFGKGGFVSGQKGKDDGEKGSGKGKDGLWTPPDVDGDHRYAIEAAQRRAKQRDRSAISQAQRSAQQRFEKDMLERVQGSWIDEAEPTTAYVVEGSMCSVSGGGNERVFRNRLGVYGGDLCWDARRFWMTLDMAALPPVGDEVERVEWKPGEGSPPTKPIVWLKGEPPKIENAEEGDAEAGAEPLTEAPSAELTDEERYAKAMAQMALVEEDAMTGSPDQK